MPNAATANLIDKESVRLLALEIGVRSAARKLGLKESTVQSWSQRGKWFAGIRKQAWNKPKPLATIATNPSEVLVNTLREHEHATRTSLALAARNMAQQSENAPLEKAGRVHEVAKTAAIVHSWGDQASRNILNIGILANQIEVRE